MEQYGEQSPWDFLVRHLDTLRLLLEDEIAEDADRDDMMQTICLEFLTRTRFAHRQQQLMKVAKDPLLSLIVCEQLHLYRDSSKRRVTRHYGTKMNEAQKETDRKQSPEEQVLRSLEFQDSLKCLDTEEISLLIQKYFLGMDYETLAGIWNCSSKALTCHMYRIRKKLRETEFGKSQYPM